MKKRLLLTIFVGLIVLSFCFIIIILYKEFKHHNKTVAQNIKEINNNNHNNDTELNIVDSIDSRNNLNIISANKNREILSPTGIIISGYVKDNITGEPVRIYDVLLERSDFIGNTYYIVIDELIKNNLGYFSFPLDQGGYYQLTIFSSKHQTFKDNYIITETGGLNNLQILLNPGHSITGCVFDDTTNIPISDVLVGSLFKNKAKEHMAFERCIDGNPPLGVSTTTDTDGCFLLQGLQRKQQEIYAFHQNYVVEKVKILTNKDSIDIRLKKGFRVFGKIDKDYIDEGVNTVYVWNKSKNKYFPVRINSDLKYCSNPMHPGKINVMIQTPSTPLWSGINYFKETKEIEIIDKDVEINFKQLKNNITWRGTLFDANNIPISKGRIIVWNKYNGQDLRRNNINRSNTCDDKGRFEIRKLLPGFCTVAVELPFSMNYFIWNKIIINNSKIMEKDIHIKGSSISGVVLDELTGENLTSGRVILRKDNYYGISSLNNNIENKLEHNNIYRIDSLNSRYKIDILNRGSKNSKYYGDHWGVINKNGFFSMMGISPGYYKILVEGFEESGIDPTINYTSINYKSKIDRNIIYLDEGQIIEKICVKIPLRGKLILNINGFDNMEIENIKCLIEGDNQNMNLIHQSSIINIKNKSNKEKQYTLSPGNWNIKIFANNLSLKRDFIISSGEITKLAINLNEFELNEDNDKGNHHSIVVPIK